MKKYICLLLVLGISLSVGCGSPKDGEPSQPDTSVGTDLSETTAPGPDLPDHDWGGENINFLVRGESAEPTNFSHEIYASEENGDVINDAVYRRNRAVQDRFNVVITETAQDD